MESKLKALKVVELKDILSKAQVTVSGKANKADLIAKILAAPTAIAVFAGSSGSSTEDAPPKVAPATQKPEMHQSILATNGNQGGTLPTASKHAESDTPAATAVPASRSPPKSAVASAEPLEPAPPPNVVDPPQGEEDPELVKRKARAARFNIPLVETTKLQSNAGSVGRIAKKKTPVDKPETLDARSKRFGTQLSKPADQAKSDLSVERGIKRGAPITESVDEEELQRRQKRAERFGTSATTVKV